MGSPNRKAASETAAWESTGVSEELTDPDWGRLLKLSP